MLLLLRKGPIKAKTIQSWPGLPPRVDCHLHRAERFACTVLYRRRANRARQVYPILCAQINNRILAASIPNIVLNYENRLFRNLSGNPFAGPPSVEIDKAWNTLLSNMHMAASPAELEKYQQTSVELATSDRHLVWLGVFHDLHCIVSSRGASPAFLELPSNRLIAQLVLQKMLRQWNYRDHYYPRMTVAEKAHLSSHAGELEALAGLLPDR